jgi:hypothetical protein
MLPSVPEGVVWAVLFLPLASFVLIVLRWQPQSKASGYMTVGAIAAAFLLSLWVLDAVIAEDGRDLGFATHEWLTVGRSPSTWPDRRRADGDHAHRHRRLLVVSLPPVHMARDSGYRLLRLKPVHGIDAQPRPRRQPRFSSTYSEMVGLCSYL